MGSADESAVVQDGEHVVAELAFGWRDVDFDAVLEVEQVFGALALPEERVERAEQVGALWGGQAISLLGTQAVQFALIWWLTVETGSAVVLASATLVALLPRALAGAFIGTLVDRWSRWRVMLVAESG